jgi:hypothetical protein
MQSPGEGNLGPTAGLESYEVALSDEVADLDLHS